MIVDTALLEADERARREALDVERSFIVQAPAGSGKTELLIQRYLHLLAIIDEPEEVVAITFTRKAAREMQARVVAALERAARGEDAAAEHEQRTLAAARRVLERDRDGDWRLRQTPRRMRIQTLDAFCASITRLLPVSSGFGGSLATNADASMQRLYRDAATATLDWLADGGDPAAAVERVLRHVDNNVGDYVDYLARMLAKRDQWLQLVGIGNRDRLDTVRAALESDIERQVCSMLRLVRAEMEEAGGIEQRRLLRYAGANLESKYGKPHRLTEVPEAEWPGTRATDVAAWRAIASALLIKDGTVRKSVTVQNGFPPKDDGEKDAFKNWLESLAARPELEDLLCAVRDLPDARYADSQWQVLLALFEVLPLAVGELQRLFSETASTDHVEVAQAAMAALGSVEEPGELAMLLDYRIRHLLVDEMQDTSIGQYRMLEQLTAGWVPGDGRTLFCVGDPMQSIYRFRDAEVGRFVAARSHGIGDVPLESLVLRRNFRSGERLVDWFNGAFPQVLPPQDDITGGAISYSPCVAVEAHAGKGAVEMHPLIDASPETEADRSAGIIQSCLEADDGDVAVLVRGRSHLPQLLADLRRRGIACQAIEIDRLTDLPEIIDLLALTRALSHDGDRMAWLAMLRAPWVGLSWADLHTLVRNNRRATVRELLQDDDRLASLSEDGRTRLQSFVELLDRVGRPHATRSLRERVEALWMHLQGPAALQTAGQVENVYRYLDVLSKIESGGRLPDVAQLEAQLDDERVSSPGDEKTRVQVMTMHKSKGLQFDHVVLHALGRQPGSSGKDVLAWMTVTHDDGDSGMIISPPAPRAASDRDPLHQFIEQAARESEHFETGRLLYVACTRAVRSLHLVGSVSTRGDGKELGTPKRSSLLARLWPQFEAQFEAAFARHAPASGADDDDAVFAKPVLRRMVATEQVLPPLPAAQRPALQAEAREVSYDWVGSAARHAGTVVHRWLERMARGDAAANALPAHFEAISRRWARGLGVADADIAQVVARTRTALKAVVGCERAQWLLQGEGEAELALTGVHQGRVVRVVIDRVKIEDGVHWLVDYKTSTHEGGDLEGFLRQQRERYRDQLQRYRAIYAGLHDGPLRTALYFPLLGEFLEVEPDEAL